MCKCNCSPYFGGFRRTVDWLGSLSLILNIDNISSHRYDSDDPMSIGYIVIFGFKTLFLLLLIYYLFYKKQKLSLKTRVAQLWCLYLLSAIFSIAIAANKPLQNPFNFLILVFAFQILFFRFHSFKFVFFFIYFFIFLFFFCFPFLWLCANSQLFCLCCVLFFVV